MPKPASTSQPAPASQPFYSIRLRTICVLEAWGKGLLMRHGAARATQVEMVVTVC